MTLSIIIASLSGLLSLMITKSSAYSSSHGQWTTSFTFSRQSFHHDGKKKWDKCWSLVDCDTKGFTELIVNTNILGTNIHGLELAPPAVIIYATIPEGPAAFLGFIFFMLFWIMSSISATSVYCFSSSVRHLYSTTRFHCGGLDHPLFSHRQFQYPQDPLEKFPRFFHNWKLVLYCTFHLQYTSVTLVLPTVLLCHEVPGLNSWSIYSGFNRMRFQIYCGNNNPVLGDTFFTCNNFNIFDHFKVASPNKYLWRPKRFGVHENHAG